MADQEPLLEIRDLKTYFPFQSGFGKDKKGFVHAVDGVSLDVYEKETLGLVGESVCGKSTLARSIIRIENVTEGSIRFMGQDITHLNRDQLRPIRRNMQIIFQDPYSSLDPRMPIGKIVEEPMLVNGVTDPEERRQRAIDMLARVGLREYVYDRYAHEFSGGQRQRIGIARALALHPQFIVCDEPTAALDVSIQSQILNLMLDMKEQFSLTYLFISHNLGVVEHFCDEILIMYLGRIVERGSCEEVYRHPCHPYTKLLLDSVPAVHPDQVSDHVPGLCVSAAPCQEGCRFANRCPCAKPVCQSQVPELREVSPGHFAACHNIP